MLWDVEVGRHIGASPSARECGSSTARELVDPSIASAPSVPLILRADLDEERTRILAVGDREREGHRGALHGHGVEGTADPAGDLSEAKSIVMGPRPRS
jgi:hypothetical protein